MSLLQYFAKANVVPTTEETGIGEKPTAEANKRVAEVLERQRLGQSTRKRRAIVHSCRGGSGEDSELRYIKAKATCY